MSSPVVFLSGFMFENVRLTDLRLQAISIDYALATFKHNLPSLSHSSNFFRSLFVSLETDAIRAKVNNGIFGIRMNIIII